MFEQDNAKADCGMREALDAAISAVRIDHNRSETPAAIAGDTRKV
jgi:hypothetical protein